MLSKIGQHSAVLCARVAQAHGMSAYLVIIDLTDLTDLTDQAACISGK